MSACHSAMHAIGNGSANSHGALRTRKRARAGAAPLTATAVSMLPGCQRRERRSTANENRTEANAPHFVQPCPRGRAEERSMSSVAAEPYPFDFDPAHSALVIIDMQRDFLEPGGFGAALGNDVSLLRRTVEPTRRLLDAARAAGMLVVHTREGHRPDLADLPPAKRARGRFSTGIGDPGPMGRILVRGEPGHDIIPELAPLDGEPVIDKPGKGAFFATDFDAILSHRGIERLIVCGVTTEVCVNTTVREANDRGYDCLVVEDCVGSYFPQFPRNGVGDDQSARRDLRLGRDVVRRHRRARAAGGRTVTAAAAGTGTEALGVRRLERLLRSVHQRAAERDRALGAVPGRRQAPGGHRVRPHPAGARDRAPARQPVLRVARLEARRQGRPRLGDGDALRA